MALSYYDMELVHKLRNRVGDVVPADKLEDDHFLIRWIRARNMDVEKAECMLRKSMEWYASNQLGRLLETKPKKNNYRYGLAGHDADGCPVLILPVGLWRVQELAEKSDLLLRHCFGLVAQLEDELKSASERFGKPVNQCVAILDYQQLAYFQCMNNRGLIRDALEIASTFESNYPERLKVCIIVNTARMFPIIFKLAKPLLSARTLGKIEIYGPQRKKWLEAIERRIPLEILPPYYGGVRQGNDEYCSNDTTLWNEGVPLPANYYDESRDHNRRRKSSTFELSARMQNTLNLDGSVWKRQEMKAGSQIELEFEVSQDLPESSMRILNWQIKSESYDIGMKVTFRADGQEVIQEVVEYCRIDCHLTPCNGSLLCVDPGVYTLVLDNSYSRRRNKMVSYNVELTENKRRLSMALTHRYTNKMD